MKVLNLIVSKEPFDLIRSGVKKEEYRKVKYFWITRLVKQDIKERTYAINLYESYYLPKYEWEEIHFKNGYQKEAPIIKCEFKWLQIKKPNPEWTCGIISNEPVFAIKLGNIIN